MSRWIAFAWTLLFVGCMPNFETPAAKTEPAKPKKESLLKRRTQDIGKYDPAAGLPLVESDVEVSASPTYALEAYGPMAQEIAEMGIQGNLELYKAEHGRYPNYDEFMTQIVKKYNVQLPVLPGKKAYQYDEENHRLVVVDLSEQKKVDESAP